MNTEYDDVAVPATFRMINGEIAMTYRECMAH